MWEALTTFGAPLQDVTPTSFTDKELVYQVGIEPNRFDVMMGIPGSRIFRRLGQPGTEYVWRRANLHHQPADLICAKRAAGRPQDLLDALRRL